MPRPKKHPVPEIKETPKEASKERPIGYIVAKHILVKDINMSLKKGMEVPEQEYQRLIGAGFGAWF